MINYVVKLPTGGHEVIKSDKRGMRFAVLVRYSMSSPWHVFDIFRTEVEANKVTPTYLEDDIGIMPYKHKCVRPVVGILRKFKNLVPK